MAIDGLVPTDGAAVLLREIIDSSYTELAKIVRDGDFTDRRKARGIMTQLRELERRTQRNVQSWVKVEIPYFYERGMFESMKNTYEAGAKVTIKQSFTQLHLEAIEALSQDTFAAMGEGLQGITRTGDRLIAEATERKIRARLGSGTITGKTRREISKEIRNILSEQGVIALRDRAGKRWDLDNYSAMLTRTNLTRANNQGVINRSIEGGYSLVKVSSHASSCPLCAPWQGRVYTISGTSSKYESLDTARSGGLFHPNCRHAITTYHEVNTQQETRSFSQIRQQHREQIEPIGGVYLSRFGKAIDAKNKRSFSQLLAQVGASYILYEALTDLQPFI
jgi:hypothetical protein